MKTKAEIAAEIKLVKATIKADKKERKTLSAKYQKIPLEEITFEPARRLVKNILILQDAIDRNEGELSKLKVAYKKAPKKLS